MLQIGNTVDDAQPEGKPERKNRRVSVQTIHRFIPDSPNHPDQRPSRIGDRIGAIASEVQRKISVKELRHMVIEEEESQSVVGDERRGPELTSDIEDHLQDIPYDFNDKVSANELFTLIEDRTKDKRKKLVNKFMSALTLHGYAQFHEAAGVRKVLWGLILAAMAVFIVRMTYLSCRSENFYKQVIEFQVEKRNEINFPTVTICSFVPGYTKAIYKRFPINVTEAEFKQFYFRILSNRRNSRTLHLQSDRNAYILHELHKEGYKTYKDVLELFEKYERIDINSVFVSRIMKHNKCTYESEPCDFKKHFRTVYRHSSQSLCQQFNSYEIGKRGLISKGNDRQNGLFMFWDISGMNYFHDDGLQGLLLEIHPYGTPHHLVDYRRSVYLEPGVCTNIDIEEEMTKMLPHPFKPSCQEKELKVARNLPYSKAACELECFLNETLEKCGCIPDQFRGYTTNLPTCNISQMNCAFTASSGVHCHECPLKCDSTDYKIFTSRIGIGNYWVHKSLEGIAAWKGKSKEKVNAYINQNIVGFRIGFKTLESHIQAYKEAVPWYERVSMLGGMMGLLLGFSVITGFELVFFLFDYLYITIKYRCTKDYLLAVLQQENVKTATQRRSERRQKRGH